MTDVPAPPSMAERHAFGLQRLAELSGLLVEQAYKRAVRAEEPEEKDRTALVFDRLARGYRLTVALEARMARDLRREAREVERGTQAGSPRAADGARPERATVLCEIDHEDEADLDVSDQSLGIRLKDLSHLLEARAELLDPDGVQRAALAEIAAWWAVGQPQLPGAKPARRPRSAGTSRAWPVRSTETAPDPSPQAAWRGSG